MPVAVKELKKRAETVREAISRQGHQLDTEEASALNFIAKGYESWMTDESETFVDDLERLYGVGGKGIKRLPMPGAVRSFGQKSGIKVHYGAAGEVYELSPEAKMADVFKGRDTPDVPLERWLAAAMLGDRCEDKKALDFAMDVKSLSTGSTGILIPEAFQGQWIDALRSQMVLQACGMTTVTMNAPTVTGARVVSDPPVNWRSEGSLLNPGDPTFELQNLVSKTLGVRVQGTAELAQDSPDFGTQLLGVMSRALAQEIDRVGILGTGLANQPRGVYNTPGIGAAPQLGGNVKNIDIIKGLQGLLEANVELSKVDRNAIMSPRTWASLEGLEAADGQPIARPKALENMTYRPSTSVPDNLGVGTDESFIMLGDFSDLVLGVRMEASLEVLKLGTYASNLMLEYIGWTRVDFLVRRPASFTIVTGVK